MAKKRHIPSPHVSRELERSFTDPALLTQLQRNAGRGQDRDDRLQTAALGVLTRDANQPGAVREELHPYLSTAVHHDKLRERQRQRREREHNVDSLEAIAEFYGGTDNVPLRDRREGPSEVAERHELQQRVRTAGLRIAQDHYDKEIFIGVLLNGHTVDAVADAIGMPTATVRNRVKRMRKELAKNPELRRLYDEN